MMARRVHDLERVRRGDALVARAAALATNATRERTAEWLSTMMRKVTFRLPEELAEQLEAEGAAMLSAGATDTHRARAGRHTSALALAARVAIEGWLTARDDGKAKH
jgi:predicted DNA-binding protein